MNILQIQLMRLMGGGGAGGGWLNRGGGGTTPRMFSHICATVYYSQNYKNNKIFLSLFIVHIANEPSVLDLIMTKEEGMIEDMQHEAPLGKSDHCMINFQFRCYTEGTQITHHRYIYDKGDYDDRTSAPTGTLYWNSIRETLNPYGVHSSQKSKKQNKITSPLRHTIRRPRGRERRHHWTNKLYKQLRENIDVGRDTLRHGTKTTRQRNKVRKLTRRLQKELDKSIAEGVKDNPKCFWKYVRKKMKTKTGVANLVMRTEADQEILTKTDQQKAEILGSFFSSVFTSEPDGAIPTLEPRHTDAPLDDIR